MFGNLNMRNKRILYIFSFLISFNFIFAESVKVVSFNLNGTARNHRFETSYQWADEIISILKKSDADIILLQEVYIPLDKRMDTPYFRKAKKNNVLDYFTSHLSGYNGVWNYFTSANYMLRKDMKISEELYKSGNNTQNNALLFNSSKFKAKDLSEQLNLEDFSGKYKFDKNSIQVIEFSDIKTSSKFVIINVHLPSVDNVHKLRDLDTLKLLFNSYKIHQAVIIGGDINISRKDLMPSYFEFVDGTDSWYYDKNFGLLTSISGKKSDGVAFANDFDHFIFSNKVKIITKMMRVNDCLNKTWYSNIKLGNHTFYNSKEYTKMISDHYPIIIEFEID